MKRVYLLFAVVAAQLLWLRWNYADRTRELAEAPVIRIDCTDYDPRDLFRGDYVSIQTSREVPLERLGASFYWDDDFCRDVNKYTRWNHKTREDEIYAVVHSLQPRPAAASVSGCKALKNRNDAERIAVYWKMGADGLHQVSRVEAPGSSADVPNPGETRALMWGDVHVYYDCEEKDNQIISVNQRVMMNLSFTRHSWKNMRFYVEEGTGDIRRFWLNEIEGKDNVPFDKVRRTVDIVLRENAPAVPRMLYLNGVPYPEAVEQMRNRTFKWENGDEKPGQAESGVETL